MAGDFAIVQTRNNFASEKFLVAKQAPKTLIPDLTCNQGGSEKDAAIRIGWLRNVAFDPPI